MAEEKSSTNVWWYVILSFIVVLFISVIQIYSASMLTNPDINNTLSNATIEYILEINGIDISDFNISKDDIEKDYTSDITNDTGSQSKDSAIEFFYSRSTASRLSSVVWNVLSLPGFIIILLRIPQNPISWLIGLLNWFWRLGIILALYYLIRGVK